MKCAAKRDLSSGFLLPFDSPSLRLACGFGILYTRPRHLGSAGCDVSTRNAYCICVTRNMCVGVVAGRTSLPSFEIFHD